jgi:hypothetical protein
VAKPHLQCLGFDLHTLVIYQGLIESRFLNSNLHVLLIESDISVKHFHRFTTYSVEMSAKPQIIIIYNADSTIRGKLNYAYKKLSSSSTEEPVCGACEITQ